MKKKAFTLVETLIASLILSMIGIICVSQIQLMSYTLYDSQKESSDRSGLNEFIFYITREIESAKRLKVSADGKTLIIQETGHDDFNLFYSVNEDYPRDELLLNGTKILDIDYENSSFLKDGNMVIISVSENGKIITVKASPRKSFVWEE